MIRSPMKGKETASAGKTEAAAGSEGRDEQAYSFRFVEVGKPSQGEGNESRSKIRSHVMRDYYEKKDNRRRPSTLPRPSSSVSQEVVLQQTHRFKVGPNGLQEVRAGQKKSKGTSRATGKAPNIVTNLPDPEEIQGQSHPSPRAATFTLSDNWHQQAEVETARGGQWSAAKSDTLIGNLLLPPQSEAGRRNITPPDTVAPTIGSIDHFKWLPLLYAPRTRLLLYHASQAILSSRVMGPLRTEWLSLAMKDQAFFHVALSHYAGNYAVARAEKDPMEAVRFKMEAIKIINERLDVVETALTDETIGTVACLASYEATNGNLSDIRPHIRGLEKMVFLRSGLQNPSINPYTKRLVLWADLKCAIAMGTNPVFPSLEYDHSGPLALLHAVNEEQAETSSGHPSGSYMSMAIDVQTLNKELKKNFNNLKRLAEINGKNKESSNPSKDDRTRDSDTLYLTERSLLTISNIWGPRKFITSGCLAAIIFIDNQLRGIDFKVPVLGIVVGRLQLSLSTVLDDISLHNLQENSKKAILWVLFVGAIAAGNRPFREWFIERILDFCDFLDIKTWEDTEHILEGFLWPGPWRDPGRVLWNEVEENRLMKYTTFPDATPDNNREEDSMMEWF